MSWNDSMLDASFRGIKFDVINTRDTFSRDVAQYEYPFVDGGDVDDLGRKPRNLRITGLLWGDDYESRLQTLLAEFDKRGNGELIHPVFGSMPKMQLIECQVYHEAENVDYCVIETGILGGWHQHPILYPRVSNGKKRTSFLTRCSLYLTMLRR
jgi:prophage DNA circulation protein